MSMHALRQALHQFRAHPWFSSLVVVLLALGIGANTTMFSLVHAVLLRPLPYPQPGELVLIRKQPTANAAATPGRGEMVTDKEYLAWSRADIPSFQGFAGFTTGSGNWRQASGADRVSFANVSDTFFPLLGVRAHRGRLISSDDTQPGAAPVGLLSYDFWQSRLGGSDGVLGTQIRVDDETLTIVGVLPPSFQFNGPAQLWRPLIIHEAASSPGGMHRISITLVRALARLKPGAELPAAQSQLDQVSQRAFASIGAPGGMRFTMAAPPSAGPATPAPAGTPSGDGMVVRRQASPEGPAPAAGEQRVMRMAAPESSAPAADGAVVRRTVPAEGPAQAPAAAPSGAPGGQMEMRMQGPGPGGAPGGPGGGAGGNPAMRMMSAFGGPVQLVSLQEYLSGAVRPTLWLLFGAVGLVLLIAIVNVANLQLARATARRHELAVRTALGASRGQLALGLLAESLVPALLGGVLGILLAYGGIHVARSLLAAQLPRVAPIEVNLTVAGFTLLVAALTGLMFGLAPALLVRRLAPQDALHTGGRTGTGAAGRTRWRQACVAIEIALALALVADAGLLLKSHLKLRAVDLGFRTGALTATLPTDENVRPGSMQMMDRAAQARLHSRMRDLAGRYQETLAAVPGVKAVAIADRAPLSEFAVMFMTNIEGYTPSGDGPEPPLSASSVGAEYFNVLGITPREGRLFTEADGDGAPLVVVVNEAFVKRYFPGQSVVGRRLASPAKPGEFATIVGVVADVRRSAMDNDPQAQVYFPFAQYPQVRLAALISYAGDPATVAAAAVESLRKLRPDLAFDVPITLDERIDRNLAPRKLVMNLLLGFAGAAVVLAALGIFGLMAYAVAQRTHEFGVRMALGADRARILGHVLRGAGLSIGIGVLGGLALGFFSSKLLEATLFAVARYDPGIFLAASAALAVIGLAASLVPALRASRVNPVEALRAD